MLRLLAGANYFLSKPKKTGNSSVARNRAAGPNWLMSIGATDGLTTGFGVRGMDSGPMRFGQSGLRARWLWDFTLLGCSPGKVSVIKEPQVST